MKTIIPAGNRLLVLTAWITLFGWGGCYPNSVENYGEEEMIIENAAMGIEEADDALEVAYLSEAFVKVSPGGLISVTGCRLTFSDDPVSKSLTVNFGDTACMSFFGRTRRGKLTVNYGTQPGDTLADKTVTFSNYYVNGKKVDGTVSLTNISFGADSVQVASRTVTDLRVEFVNNSAVTFNGSHDRRWISGRADSLVQNNVYSYSGSVTGFSGNGRTFKQDITTPVVANFYCAYLGYFARTSGVVELSVLQGYPQRQRTVNYGSGLCDNTITIETFRRTYGATPD